MPCATGSTAPFIKERSTNGPRWPLASARAATGPSSDTSPHKSLSATTAKSVMWTH